MDVHDQEARREAEAASALREALEPLEVDFSAELARSVAAEIVWVKKIAAAYGLLYEDEVRSILGLEAEDPLPVVLWILFRRQRRYPGFQFGPRRDGRSTVRPIIQRVVDLGREMGQGNPETQMAWVLIARTTWFEDQKSFVDHLDDEPDVLLGALRNHLDVSW